MAKSDLLRLSVASLLLVAPPAWAQLAPPDGAPVALGFASDRFVVQLTPAAARVAYVPAASGARRARLGLPALDRVLAAWPGAWLEPEFRGDPPPAPGSSATDFSGFYLVHLPPGVSRDEALSRCRALPEVTEAHPSGLAQVAAVPNDSLWSLAYYFYQPSRRDIRAPETWDVTKGDTSIVIAIVDTGVLPYHPDLGGTVAGGSGHIWTNWIEAGGQPNVDDDGNGFVDDAHGWDFVSLISDDDAVAGEDWRDQDADPNDYVGHGTCVAGLAGAIDDNRIGVTGTAWNVRLMPLRVGWSSVRQPAGIVDMSYVAQAVRYATLMRADVINISLSNTPQNDLYVAVKAALDSNITVVVAAGNNGSPNYIAEQLPDAIVVAATDAYDMVPVWSNRTPYVDLAAPGVSLATTVLSRPGADSLGLRTPSYVPDASGTSFAAPLVSGAVALIDAARRSQGMANLSPRQSGTLLRYTAEDIAAQNPGITGYGAGRLSMARAVEYATRIESTPSGIRTVGAGVLVPTGDGAERLVYVNEGGSMVFLDADPLKLIGATPLGDIPISGLAAADLGGRRGLGFFVAGLDRIGGYGGAGAALPGWPVTVPWGPVGTPVLGDLDGDGTLEIVCQAANGYLWAWHATGEVYPGFPIATAVGPSLLAPLALADIDGQPGVEILSAQPDGAVCAFRWTTEEAPGWPVRTNDPLPAGPVVAADEDGRPLVVVSGSEALHGIRADGSEAFRTDYPTQQVTADPALGDLDGDGVDDVVIATKSAVRAYDLAGRALPGWPAPLAVTSVGPPIVGYFAASDTEAVYLQAGNTMAAWSGAGRRLKEFPPFPDGDALGAITIPGEGGLRLAQGTSMDDVFYVYDSPSPQRGLGAHAWPTPRGNFARTASRLYEPPVTGLDVVPPLAVGDLEARPFGGSGSTLLTWTSPRDVGPAQGAVEYDVRYSRYRADLVERFTLADRLPTPAPRPAGLPESLYVALPDYIRYFAVRSRDASGNWSAVTAPAYRQGLNPLVETAALALAVRTNPATAPIGFAWQVAGTGARAGTIRIHDPRGRRVRSFTTGSAARGVTLWDGRDERGREVPAGVYFATLSVPGQVTTTRFVLLR